MERKQNYRDTNGRRFIRSALKGWAILRQKGELVAITIESVIRLCQANDLTVDVMNLAVGTLMLDKTGIVGRGSAATSLKGGQVPRFEEDAAILEAAQTFIVRPRKDKPFLLNREEFEMFEKEAQRPQQSKS